MDRPGIAFALTYLVYMNRNTSSTEKISEYALSVAEQVGFSGDRIVWESNQAAAYIAEIRARAIDQEDLIRQLERALVESEVTLAKASEDAGWDC